MCVKNTTTTIYRSAKYQLSSNIKATCDLSAVKCTSHYTEQYVHPVNADQK